MTDFQRAGSLLRDIACGHARPYLPLAGLDAAAMDRVVSAIASREEAARTDTRRGRHDRRSTTP